MINFKVFGQNKKISLYAHRKHKDLQDMRLSDGLWERQQNVRWTVYTAILEPETPSRVKPRCKGGGLMSIGQDLERLPLTTRVAPILCVTLGTGNKTECC